MALTALVVDDEPLARSRLQRLLETAGVSVSGEGVDGVQAIELCQHVHADLLFLDINMPRMNGLEAAEKITAILEHPPAIIFCTAYDEFALQAFESNASAYLLKPVTLEDVQLAIARAGRLNRMQIESAPPPTHENVTLVMRGPGRLETVAIDDVLYFRSIEKHVYAYIRDRGQSLVDKTLKELQREYAGLFVRTHRSTLVNRAHFATLRRTRRGSLELTVVGSEQVLPVSRRHVSEVKKCFERA